MLARALLLFVASAVASGVASGCSLYFGPSTQSPEDDVPPPDAHLPPPDAYRPPPDAYIPPDAYVPPDGAMARCEDSQLYAVPTTTTWPEAPGHGAGRLIGRCPGACRSAAVVCSTPDCGDAARTLCDAPISLGATCPLEGSACRGSRAVSCPESTTCGVAVPGSSCSCMNGTYRCTQLTAAAATQASIVGKWRGTVTTPGFTPPYPVTLWIYPDGTYWAECALEHCTAFYYGGDGPSPRRKLTILSTSDTLGSSADIAIDFGYSPPDIGAVNALAVDATTLRFTFFASWFGCNQPIDFNLTRY